MASDLSGFRPGDLLIWKGCDSTVSYPLAIYAETCDEHGFKAMAFHSLRQTWQDTLWPSASMHTARRVNGWVNVSRERRR